MPPHLRALLARRSIPILGSASVSASTSASATVRGSNDNGSRLARTRAQPSRQARRPAVRERLPAEFEGDEFLLPARPANAGPQRRLAVLMLRHLGQSRLG